MSKDALDLIAELDELLDDTLKIIEKKKITIQNYDYDRKEELISRPKIKYHYQSLRFAEVISQ